MDIQPYVKQVFLEIYMCSLKFHQNLNTSDTDSEERWWKFASI